MIPISGAVWIRSKRMCPGFISWLLKIMASWDTLPIEDFENQGEVGLMTVRGYHQVFVFLFFGHTLGVCRILVHQGSNPHPLQGKQAVLTTGPPGKSLGVLLPNWFLQTTIAVLVLLYDHRFVYSKELFKFICVPTAPRGKIVKWIQIAWA